MKTFLRSFLLSAGLIFCFIQVQAQRTALVISDGMAVDETISEDLKEQILDVIQEVMNKYYNTATFWDEVNDQFSDDKYTEFLSMFSGSARVYDDIADEPTNIGYSVYGGNVYSYMQDEGVQFELENIYINSISSDGGGFYVADIDMDKIVNVGLDADNFPVKFVEGRRYTLNMKIDMPDYDVTDAKIQSILGMEKAARIKTSSYLSVSGHYGLGIALLNPAGSIGEAFGDVKTNSSVYGGHLYYRKALNPEESFWFIIGAGVQNHSINADLANYSNASLKDDKKSSASISRKLNGAPPSEENVEAILRIDNIKDGGEEMSILNVDVPLGVSVRLLREFKYRFFLDIVAVPSFSISSDGGLSGTVNGLILPKDDDHFPSIETIQATKPSILENAPYKAQLEFVDDNLTTTSNFNLGFMLSPTFHYDIDFNYGFEIGINLWANVLSLTAVNTSEDGFLSKTYDASEQTFNSTTTILEEYFKDVRPINASVKLGFFYKLN